MADAVEALRQHMDQHAADELAHIERHGGVSRATFDAVVLDPEGHAGRVGLDEPAVGDCDAVRVAREIGQHGLSIAAGATSAADRSLAASDPRLAPELQGQGHWIDVVGLPPGGFVSPSVKLAMVETTERDRKLVADLSAERTRLGKAEMMRIAGRPAANETGLPRNELAVLLVAQSNALFEERSFLSHERGGAVRPAGVLAFTC